MRGFLALLFLFSLQLEAYTPFNGLYASMDIGPVYNQIEINDFIADLGFLDLSDINTLETEFSHTAEEMAPSVGLSFGWGRQFCSSLYFGVCAGVHLCEFDVHARFQADFQLVGDDPLLNRIKDRNRVSLNFCEYTVDARPGFVVGCDTLLFGIGGLAFNRISLDCETEGVLVTNSVDEAVMTPTSEALTTLGLRGGFGLEQKISPCVSVVLTYVYTHYLVRPSAMQKRIVRDANGMDIFSVLSSTQARARRQSTSIGLSYYF